MSKNCFLVVPLTEAGPDLEHLKKRIARELNSAGLGAFFSFPYDDPVLTHFLKTALVCSIADDSRFDNCEMLLLPDSCGYNGKRNPTPFFERMQRLADVFASLSLPSFELLIGDSGTDYTEYKVVRTNTAQFPAAISQEIRQYELPPLHFILEQDID